MINENDSSAQGRASRLRERYERRMEAIERTPGFYDNRYLIGLRDAHLDVIEDLRAEEGKPPLVADAEAALSTAAKMMKETETKEGSIYYYWQGRYDEAESALHPPARRPERPLCPCGMPMARSAGGWMCPDWFIAWTLGEPTTAHEIEGRRSTPVSDREPQTL